MISVSLWAVFSPIAAEASAESAARPDAGADHQIGLEGDPVVLSEFVFAEAGEGFPSSHSSDLLELENGDLLCTWFGGSKEGANDVEVWLSRKPRNGNWTTPEKVTEDATRTVFNPVLFQPRGGDVMLFYKTPDINTGMMITSRDGGFTWSNPATLPVGIVGPIVNKPVQLDDGVIISGSSTQREQSRIHVERSVDGGLTWSRILIDGYSHGVIQPTILVHSPRRLQLLMRTDDHSPKARMPHTWSDDAGLTWSPITESSLPNNNSALDAVTLADGRQLLVYNHSTREAPKTGHKGRGILNVAVSDDGVNWKAALVLDYLPRGNGLQFSYPAVIQSRDGLVHVSYTWHRKRIKHVVIDPSRLELHPIVNGDWPRDEIPWVVSDANPDVQP